MKYKKLANIILSMALLSTAILSPIPFSTNSVEAKAGTRLGSVALDKKIREYLDIPLDITLGYGPLKPDKEDVLRPLFFGWNKEAKSSGGGSYLKSSSEDVGDYYYAQDLPFNTTINGKMIPLYCGQSRTGDPEDLTFAGIVTDARVYALLALDDPLPTTIDLAGAGREAGKQMILWAALNSNWSPNLFTNALNTKASDFANTNYKQAIALIGDFKSYWPQVIAKSTAVKVKPVQPTSYTAPVITSAVNKIAIAQIAWQFVDGGSLATLNQVADITYTGLPANAEVVHGYQSDAASKLGISSVKKNSDYVLFKNVTSGGTYDIQPKVTYKGDYEYMNKFILAYYEAKVNPSGNQPFVAPIEPPKLNPINIKFDFTPTCTIDCGGTTIPTDPTVGGSVTETPLRWYNMPSAFGEIKTGMGYNSNGETVQGTYASTRSQEPFEAMLGTPSTERFYVNLGGTEGYIDVFYNYVEAEQEFAVKWTTKWTIPPPAGSPVGTASQTGTESFDKTSSVKYKAMHLESASFRVFGNGQANNADLGISVEVQNTGNATSSFALQPKTAGLQTGPGTGTSNYNLGNTTSWQTSVINAGATTAITGRKATESDGKSTAFGKANSTLGQAFAQNDALTITIAGKQYVFVPDVNQKTATIFGGSSSITVDATNGQGKSYFKPLADRWDVWSHIPIKGYNGNPEDDSSRNIGGAILKSENISIAPTQGNGTYPFEEYADQNYVKYETVTTVKGAAESLHEDVSELDGGGPKGTASGYANAKDPTSISDHISGDIVMTQYTNWQVPETSGENSLQFKHSGKEPDGDLDQALTDNPAYKSINPVVIHSPVSNMYAWISDIPSSQLQDQRILASSNAISINSRATTNGGANGPARQYIDYDFKISVPNTGAFNKYWSQASSNSAATGIVDPDFTEPGTLGKGYIGSALGKNTSRLYNNPYLSGSGQWDVSKWLNAKYVKFPYDVYYYKNSGENGGDEAGFYSAGTWIKLYDDNQSVRVGDATEFNFHVTSNARDTMNGIVYFVSEAINSPAELIGDGDNLYNAAEQYTNGTRKTAGSVLGNYVTARNGEATYASANSVNVDLIGRIGNVLVSDATDPAWSSVFWKTNNGQIQTQEYVQKDYGVSYNIYDSLTKTNSTGFPAFDRYNTIASWHGESEPIHTLPLGKNVLTSSQTDQTVKLGYNIGGSVQTIGDYDYSMWIYPQNMLAGTFRTGKPGDPFKLVTADQYTAGAAYKEYYNYNINNSINGNPTTFGKNYTPTYKYNLSSTLADPRMKISPWEVRTPEYKDAVRKGTTSKVIIGTPSWMEIPQSLRTWIGSTITSGKWGLSGQNGNNGLGSKAQEATCDCPKTLTNIQKWNWNYGLPQNTKIWFYNNAAGKSKDGNPIYESATKDQYIYTSMIFRTKAVRNEIQGQGDPWQTSLVSPAIFYNDHYLVHSPQSIPNWDLTMFTNTGNNGIPDITGTVKDIPKGLTVGSGQNGTWDPSQVPEYSSPKVPIVFWNYSQSASTDKDSVGTH